MRWLKGLLAVIITYVIGVVTYYYRMLLILQGQADPISTAIFGISRGYINQYVILSILTILIGGIVFYFIRAGLAHAICKKGFKAKGDFKETLYAYGVSHFPFILSYISFFLFFFGNMGIFLMIFFAIFPLLLVYAFFAYGLMATYGLSGKKSAAVVVMVELIILAAMLFLQWGILSIYSLMNMQTFGVTGGL